MSDQTIISIVGSVVGLVGTIFTGVMVYFMTKLKADNEKAAVEVKKVATTLEATSSVADRKLNAIAKVADATHKLVNSNMGIQLRATAIMARRVANLTNMDGDIKNAEEAEWLQAEHARQQSNVDDKYPGGIPDSQDPPKPKHTDSDPT